MDKIILVSLMMCVGCASTGAPGGNPCKKRGFDDWVSFYDLKDKAESSWNEGYQNAYRWLDEVARACYPERFEKEDDGNVEDEGNNETLEEDNQGETRKESEGRPVYEVPQDFFKIQAQDVTKFEEEE